MDILRFTNSATSAVQYFMFATCFAVLHTGCRMGGEIQRPMSLRHLQLKAAQNICHLNLEKLFCVSLPFRLQIKYFTKQNTSDAISDVFFRRKIKSFAFILFFDIQCLFKHIWSKFHYTAATADGFENFFLVFVSPPGT